jgi:hypothetical protein
MALLSFNGPVRTHDFTLYRLAATHFGATDLPRSLDRVSPKVKEEFQAVLASAEYLAFVQSFFSLVEDECLRMKLEAKEQGADAVIHQMPALISLVNCVGYFRGQDGMFRHAHPASVADTQKLLYQMEDRVEGLLNELIELLLSSESTKERYKERLTSYFVHSRTGEKSTTLW